MTGIALGVGIGLLSGIAIALLLWTILTQAPTVDTAVKVIGELLALPMFWFGGQWMQTAFIQEINSDELRTSYIPAAVVTLVIVASWPIYQAIVKIGRDFQKASINV